MHRIIIAVAVCSATALPATAQNHNDQGVASITGVIRDTSSGHYSRGFLVCTFIRTQPSIYSSRCERADSTGSYTLDKLPLTGLRVSVQCPKLRGFAKLVAEDSVTFTGAVPVRHDWRVSSTGCDPRPVREITGIFRGRYTPGFESSKFVPCAADAWFVPGDSLGAFPYDVGRAWATWRGASHQDIKWPEAPRDQYNNPTYYVRWRGTVVGPGGYGHMGVSPFQIFVDSVLELRLPTERDCR